MSVRLKGTDSIVQIRWIPRYTGLERFLHWVHRAAFIPLVLTGFVRFNPWLLCQTGCVAVRNVRILHRVAAIVFGGTPIIHGILQPRRMLMHVASSLPSVAMISHGSKLPRPITSSGTTRPCLRSRASTPASG